MPFKTKELRHAPRTSSLPCRMPELVGLAFLPWFVCEYEVDPAAEGWVGVAPPFDEAWWAGIGFRILGELHEGAGHRFVLVRQLESENVGLMLDVA